MLKKRFFQHFSNFSVFFFSKIPLVLNTFTVSKAYEVDLAIAHLAQTRTGDLLTMDRNYPSYRMLAEMSHLGRDFVVCCSVASFAVARQMLKGEGADSQIVTLTPCAVQMPLIQTAILIMNFR